MTSREQRLVETLVDLADTLVDDFDIVDHFYTLVEKSVELLDVDQAGLLLANAEGELQVAAVTSEGTRIIELVQTEIEQGPCHDAFKSGQRVVASLSGDDAEKRWPIFTERARAEGFETVIALPMRLRDRTIGALGLFRTSGGSPSQQDLAAAKALADVATIAILQERATKDSDLLIGQLQEALDSRVTIEQAKGIIAQKLDLTMEEAFARLRRHARNQNRPLRETAGDIVSGRLDAAQLPVE